MKKIILHVVDRYNCPFRQPAEHASEALFNHNGLCDYPNQYVDCSDDKNPTENFPNECPLKDGDIYQHN